MAKHFSQRAPRPAHRDHGGIPSFDSRVSSFCCPAAWLAALAGLVFLVAYPVAAYGQGCPLCYNTAAAAKAGAIQALRSGILILIIPSLAICAGILGLGIRARNRFNEPDDSKAEPQQEMPEMPARIERGEEVWKLEIRNSLDPARSSRS